MKQPDLTQPTETPKRSRRKLVVLLLALASGPLLAELGLRLLLFHPSDLAREWAGGLRSPGHFAGPGESAFWRLSWKLESAYSKETAAPPFDPKLGWVKPLLSPQQYELTYSVEVGDRHPIVLYGASFAEGTGPLKERMEYFLETSERARSWTLVNYGVGGYGPGQVYLLMEETLDRFADQNAHVVVVLVVDSDLERVALDFRSGPKPVLLQSPDGSLAADPVEPGGSAAYIERRGVGVASYAWRYIVHSDGLLSEGLRRRLNGAPRREAKLRAQLDQVLSGLQEQWKSRGLTGHVVLAASPDSLARDEPHALESFAEQLLQDRGVRVVLAREAFQVAARRDALPLSDYFIQDGPGVGHPNGRGNQVLLECVLEGVEPAEPSALKRP